jgi:copper chaperone CopZ
MELSLLPGVSAVDVDLETGTVTVDSEKELDRAQVAAAIDEAGYELASN